MRTPRAPRLDQRRTPDFSVELRERARAWIPSWGLADGERDFGRALLEVAARFSSEVAERLDGAGEKMRRGFLDWLGVRGEAARPARVPVVFKLADAAREGVLASAPVRMQADAGGVSVVLETEKDVRVVPGRLTVVVGVDGEADAFYLSPPGLSDLKPLEPLPVQWQLKSFAAAGATKLQLDPELGLAAGMIVEAAGQQYRIVQADKEIVTIEPPLTSELPGQTVVRKVTAFAPFDGPAHNRQEHALYLGHMELLNIEAAATIEIVGAQALRESVAWQYWGKVDPDEEVGWQTLTLADEADQRKRPDAVVLTKPKGAIEPREIGGKSSRWIRGTTKKITGPGPMLSVDELKLRVNCSDDDAPCPPDENATSGPTAEAMANSTPLVLSEPFYPLGREPRQFDAFYLGCTEAFSKKGAHTQVCFEMSDATCRAYAAVRDGAFANQVLAGVGKDRALHLFKINPSTGAMTAFRGPLRPPLPADAGVQADQPAPVNLNPRCRPVIWSGVAPNVGDLFVAVASGGAVWIWHENAGDQKLSGWKRHSSVPSLPGAPAQIEDIIVLKSAPTSPGAVLSGGRFWVFNDPNWIQPPQPQPPKVPLRDYAALAPIYDANLAPTDSMVAVSLLKELYRLEPDGTESPIAPGLQVDIGIAPGGSTLPVGGIRPAAIDGPLRVVAVGPNGDELVGVQQGSAPQVVSLGAGAKAIGAEIAIDQALGTLQFSVGAKMAIGGTFVVSWTPTFVAADPTVLFESRIPDASGAFGGTPLLAGPYLVVPGDRGDAFVAPYDPSQRLSFATKVVVEGVILPGNAPFTVNDFLSVMPQTAAHPRMGWTVVKPPSVRGTEVIYAVDPVLGEYVADDPQLIGYRVGDALTGVIQNLTAFKPDAPDPAIVPRAILRVTAGAAPVAFCEVQAVNAGVVTVLALTPLPANSGSLFYWKPNPSVARVVPAIEFLPWGDGNWDASILDRAKLYFPVLPAAQPLQPSPQRATAFGVISKHPTVVALEERWTSAPPPLNAPTPFIIDGVIGAWQHQLADSSSNPALSWEYWNGKGWWSLAISGDGTNRLATTGAVKFTVPHDIAESDWAGKTSFWIRARLVGGDYGREEVKVISKQGSNSGDTEQIVERSTANIKSPQVLDLHISYSICQKLFPSYVFAEDTGTIRNQSDANRTAGAIVEAFVPLAVTLGRLSGPVSTPEAPGECPPPCQCPSEPAAAVTPVPAASPATGAPQPAIGRALFIGLNAALSETPVNVLLLVDEERPHEQFAPMKIEALVADRFVPVVADDATRALGESGLLSMAFALEPTPRELFGMDNLTWLRLTPGGSDPASEWKPALRGAYLNAVWASAAETLTRELLGSSDGAPGLTVHLARPPVLRDSLELRVKEPLGEEERQALLQKGEDRVLSAVDGLPGDWVLWQSVIDPGDEPAAARVYALDESIGEIRFGDGQHGAIPPIGPDSIVAFSYRRTELGTPAGDGVPANAIAARTALNLVSPVESVEAVFAADQAAGGAPPETAERVLRFGTARLRHRNRAVTARDFEDLALQSSPDVVQARCFARGGQVRLVVVMRGEDPLPNAAEVRELLRLLLAAAPASLSAPQALRITGPRIRRLRVALRLRVASLDDTGEVSRTVKGRIRALLDSATGGTDGEGWALGESLSEEDIALALIDTRRVEGLARVTLQEVMADGAELPWTGAVERDELVMLDKDSVRLEFETVEVIS